VSGNAHQRDGADQHTARAGPHARLRAG
jgi:hypothetical protein